MPKQHKIKPDFTIDNINAVNNDPGARNFVGGTTFRPSQNVKRLAQNNSNIRSTHKDEHSVVNKINLTALDFDGNSSRITFLDNSDFSFIRTIEQNTINFTNNNANSKITVPDNSTLSMNKSLSTRVSNFAKGTSNTYYTAADTDDLSFAKIEGETQVINFPGSNINSRILVNDADSLSFVEEISKSTLNFNGTAGHLDAADHSGYSFVEDTEVSALQFSANANSKVHMSAYDADFSFRVGGGGNADTPFAFAFWVNAAALGSTRYLFGFYGGEYYCFIDTTGSIRIVLRDQSLGVTNQFLSPLVSSNRILGGEVGNWVHIAIVYTPETSADANDEQVQFYKNGSAWGSAVESPNDSYVAMEPNVSARFTIGHYNHGNTSTLRFTGMLSNFLVFKHDGQNNHASVARSTTPLTANEVNGLYNAGKVVKDYNDHPKGADLIGYWKMDEDVSEVSQITDYSGENNHLNTIGSAITEDSTSGLSLRQDVSFTWTFWMRKTDKTTNNQNILHRFHATNPEYILQVDGRKLQLVLYDTTGMSGTGNYNTREYITNGTFLSDSETDWEHITVVYNRDTKEVTFHRNGGSAQTGTANDTQTLGYNDDPSPAAGYSEMQDTGTGLTVGANAAGSSGFFEGQLAQLAMFRHDGGSAVMTTNEVKGLYNGGFAYDYRLRHPKKNDLTAYYKFYGNAVAENSLGNGFIMTGISQSSTGLKEKQDVDFTFSFWLKRPVQGAGILNQTLIHKNNEYFVRLGGGINNLQISVFRYDRTPVSGDGATDTASWVSSSTFLNNDANWQHVAIKYDASERTMYFYRNGALITTDSTPSNSDYNESENATGDLAIGMLSSGFSMPLIGELAHLAMFKHDGGSALMSDAEVYKLYDRDGTSGSPSSVEGNVYHLKPVHAKAGDLVGYWHLDEDVSSTATITDYSGLSNNGATTGVGTTILTNPANSGLDSANFVDVSFSISFWMKKASTSGQTQRILSKGTSLGTDREYMVQIFNRSVYLYLYDNTPTDGVGTSGISLYNTSTTFLSNNNTEWEHITIVYDASTQNVIFYKNGENAQTVTAALADNDNDYDSMFNGTGLFYIGQMGTSTASGMDGQLAHLAVFKHDGQSGRSSTFPTAAEVKGGYNGGNVYDLNTSTQHAKKADIVGYWKLNGTTATVGGNLTAGAGITTSVNSSLLTTEDVDMTFAFWFKKSAAEPNVRTIVAKNNEYQIFVNGQDLQFRMFDAYPSDGGAASYKTHYKAGFVADNTNWQHIVIKYDASTETATAILNAGTPTAMSSTGLADHDDFHDTTSQLTIGYSDFQTSLGFAGQIAQLAVFKHDGLSGRSSTILTDNEAKGLYNGGNVYDYTRHPKKDDLVGYWKLNQTVGNNVVVTDSSAEGNNGVMTGATSLTNPANSGLNEVKDNSFTVGFWMNKDSKTDIGNVIYKSLEYYIRVSSRNLQLVIYDSTDMDSNTSGAVSATTTTDPLADNTGTWEHVVVSYDAANRQVLFFVDKVLKQTVSVSSDTDYNETQDGSNVLRIGHTTSTFDGKLSNVIMFDHGAAGAPFDATDAEELYSDGHVYDYNNHSRASDIVAWWKLDGNGNDSHTGGSHNGTITGATSAANSGLYYFEDQDFAIGFYVRPLDTPGHPAVRFFFDKQSANWSYYNDTTVFIKLMDATPKQVGGNIAAFTEKLFFFNFSPTPNVFTHILYSYDSSEGKMHLYVNGVEQGSGTTGTPDEDYQESQINEAGTFNIGNSILQNVNPDADFSYFVIFKGRHLTEAEAEELYNNGLGYDYTTHSRGSDISAFYRLDGTTSNIIDYSGNGNNMTATNAANVTTDPQSRIPGRKKLPQLPIRMSIPGLASLRTNPQK